MLLQIISPCKKSHMSFKWLQLTGKNSPNLKSGNETPYTSKMD